MSVSILDFDWSLSNDFIVSASVDGSSRLWNPTSGQCLRIFKDNFLCPVLSCRFQPLNNNMIVVSLQTYLHFFLEDPQFSFVNISIFS